MALLSAALWTILLGPAHDHGSLARLTRATVWVRAGDRATGTGWLADADRRWVVTARHVVRDSDRIDVHFLDAPDGRAITERTHYLTARPDLERRRRIAGARVVATRDDADLALLVVDHLPPDVPALPVTSGPAPAGEPCRAVGHRHDADLLWGLVRGPVRQTGRLTEGYHAAGKRLGAGKPVLLLQMPTEAGESGAAVVNRAGQVVGVVSAVAHRTPGVSIAIAAPEVEALLAQARKADAPKPAERAAPAPADAAALARATVWVRPQATNGRAAGVLIDRDRRLVLTSAAAVGSEDLVDVVAPRRAGDRPVAELAEYRDLLGLRLSGHCARGFVLARDPGRDLALIELHSVQPGLSAIPRRDTGPAAGESVAAMTHPVSEELLWLYAAGSVRALGPVVLERDPPGDPAKRRAALLQLPHQGSSSGGPVVDERGELVGVLSAREGARQDLGYAATAEEVAEFLASARPLWAPETAAEWHRRALFLAGRARPDEWVAAHARAAALAPEDATVLAAHARALAGAGRAEEAPAAAGRAERARGRPPAADAILAEAYRSLDDPEGVRRLAGRALAHEPGLPSALVARAAVRSGADALRDLDEAIFRDPANGRAYRDRAGRRDRGTPDGRAQALADVSRAIELDPLELEYRMVRARWYEEAGDFKKAVKDRARLTELRPLVAAFRRDLADAQLSAKDEPAGLETLSALARLDGGAGPAFHLIRRHAERLRAQDPARWAPGAKDWYGRSLRAVRPHVAGGRQADIDRVLSALDGADATGLGELGEKLKAWGQGPPDRFD